MRRHISFLAALFTICFTGAALAQQPYFTIETKARGAYLTFPVLSNAAHGETAKKINRFLQLSELKIVQGYENKDIFEMMAGEEPDDYDISFEVKENSPRLLSVHFNIASCGATCYYWTACYNFNAQTGEPVQLGDLLTAEGLEAFSAKATARWAAQMDAALKKQDAETIDDMQQFKSCLESEPYTLLESFYVHGNDLYVDAENCLPKYARFYDIDTAIRFSIKELVPYVNDYGRSIFGLTAKLPSGFNGELLKELFVYCDAGKNTVLALVKGPNDYTEVYYTDLKNNIRQVFEGNCGGSTLKLSSYDGGDKVAHLTATVTGNKVSVVYEDALGKKMPPVVLVRE